MLDKIVSTYRKAKMSVISDLSGTVGDVLDETNFYDLGYMQSQVKRIQNELARVSKELEINIELNEESDYAVGKRQELIKKREYLLKHMIYLASNSFQNLEECKKMAKGYRFYKIADGVTRQKTMMEERFKQIRLVAPNELEEMSKLSFYHWYRLTNFSADNYGYLMCGSMKTAIQTILKLVLNSVMLAEQVDIKEFIGQASEINRLDDTVYNYTKADESAPYALHRIQNLLAYAVSDRGMKARKELEL